MLIGSKKTDCDPEEASVSSSESLDSLELSAPKPTSLPLPKTFPRPRSNSIPPTPTTNQVKVESVCHLPYHKLQNFNHTVVFSSFLRNPQAFSDDTLHSR